MVDADLKIAETDLVRSRQELADGDDDHHPDRPGEEEDQAGEEDGDQEQEFHEFSRGPRRLLLLEGEGQGDQKRGAAEIVGDGQGLEGIPADPLPLGPEGGLLTAQPVIDLAVKKLGEEAGIEELAPARGQEPGVPVEVDVVGQGGADPEDQVFRRGGKARRIFRLDVDEVLQDAPGETRVAGGFLDETVGEDPVEEVPGEEREKEQRDQGDRKKGRINPVGE